jgi:hypothetical protein
MSRAVAQGCKNGTIRKCFHAACLTLTILNNHNLTVTEQNQVPIRFYKINPTLEVAGISAHLHVQRALSATSSIISGSAKKEGEHTSKLSQGDEKDLGDLCHRHHRPTVLIPYFL